MLGGDRRWDAKTHSARLLQFRQRRARSDLARGGQPLVDAPCATG